jgi:hypothetical protein
MMGVVICIERIELFSWRIAQHKINYVMNTERIINFAMREI